MDGDRGNLRLGAWLEKELLRASAPALGDWAGSFTCRVVVDGGGALLSFRTLSSEGSCRRCRPACCGDAAFGFSDDRDTLVDFVGDCDVLDLPDDCLRVTGELPLRARLSELVKALAARATSFADDSIEGRNSDSAWT